MKLHKLTCPNCNGTMDVEIAAGTSSVFCPYCGQKFLLDDEKKEYTINKNININKTNHIRYTDDADTIRAKNEANEDKRNAKLILIPFIIAALLLGGLFLNKSINQMQGKINAGYYRDLVGKDYKSVEAHFKAAGFTNIELVDLNDAGITFWKDEKVDTISVGGKTDFDSINWFFPDTKVIISYH